MDKFDRIHTINSHRERTSRNTNRYWGKFQLACLRLPFNEITYIHTCEDIYKHLRYKKYSPSKKPSQLELFILSDAEVFQKVEEELDIYVYLFENEYEYLNKRAIEKYNKQYPTNKIDLNCGFEKLDDGKLSELIDIIEAYTPDYEDKMFAMMRAIGRGDIKIETLTYILNKYVEHSKQKLERVKSELKEDITYAVDKIKRLAELLPAHADEILSRLEFALNNSQVILTDLEEDDMHNSIGNFHLSSRQINLNFWLGTFERRQTLVHELLHEIAGISESKKRGIFRSGISLEFQNGSHKYTWLNEAITELLTREATDQVLESEIYKEERDLFIAVLTYSKGKLSVNDFLKIYFNDEDHGENAIKIYRQNLQHIDRIFGHRNFLLKIENLIKKSGNPIQQKAVMVAITNNLNSNCPFTDIFKLSSS